MAKVAPEGGSNVRSASGLDFNNRDPKMIHDPAHFQVAWEEVFAEPDPGVHSIGCCWKASYLVFSYTRLWTYRICSLLGVFSACCFGLDYGCTACYLIWCCWPCLKLYQLCVIPIKKCLDICLDTFCMPCIRALSMLLFNIRVVIAKDSPTVTEI